MSRSGYSDDFWEDGDNSGWLYRANVDRAIAGKRGQAFLRELIAALDALPEKKLIAESFAAGEGVCALGSVARVRGVAERLPDPEQCDEWEVGARAAKVLGIAECMAREIMDLNDEGSPYWCNETDDTRWARVRQWAESNLRRVEP